MLSHLGLIVDWEVATANVYDDCAFQQVVERNTAQMVLFSDEGFAKKDGIRKTSRSASGASGIPA